MKKIAGYALQPNILAFFILSILTLSNVLIRSDKLDAFKDFSSHLLANSAFNVPYKRSMDTSIIPGYIMVTFATNYVISIMIKKINVFRVAAFVGTILLVSAAVSVASTVSYLSS